MVRGVLPWQIWQRSSLKAGVPIAASALPPERGLLRRHVKHGAEPAPDLQPLPARVNAITPSASLPKRSISRSST